MPFVRLCFGEPSKHVIPSAVYFSPWVPGHPVLIGDLALNGFRSNPVPTKSPIYSNLKTLFKKDLSKSKRELGHSYFFHSASGIEETTPERAATDFLKHYFKSLVGWQGASVEGAQVYIGKPAFSEGEERRYTECIRRIFKELRFKRPPKLIYEPYAIFYYCRFGMLKSFQRTGSQSANILIIDHGGGTINTCVVQTTRQGNLKRSRPKGPMASHHGGSLLDQYLLIRAIKALRLSTDYLLQILTEKNELKIVRKEQLLLSVEKLKLKLFSDEAHDEDEAEEEIHEPSIPGVPKPWKLRIKKQDVREGFLQIWRGCHDTIAATLKSSDIQKVQFVVLAGGTCRLKYHEALLKKDFGEFLNADTEFIDISDHDKPVAFGLAIQAALDSMDGALGEASETSKEDENLSDYLARDLRVRIETAGSRQESLRLLSDETIASAGTPKADIWERGLERNLTLSSRPKQLLSYAFLSGRDQGIHNSAIQNGASAEINDGMAEGQGLSLVEGETIRAKQKYVAHLERCIRLKIQVNEAGHMRPQFFLAPKKVPNYFEPDRAACTLYLPDLEAKPKSLVSTAKSDAIQISNLAVDFGTSTTCACGVDLPKMVSLINAGKPLLAAVPAIGYAGVPPEGDSSDYRKPLAVLRSMNLHPQILLACEKLFQDGHYGAAIFASLKMVEQTVRERAGNPKAKAGGELYGRYLMTRAFSSDNPLVIVSDISGTQDAYRDLFSGIMGIRGAKFAHGPDDAADSWEAVVWIGLCSLLLQALPEITTS